MINQSTPVSERRLVSVCGRPSLRQMVWVAVFAASLPVGVAVHRRMDVPPLLGYLLAAIPLLAGAMYMRTMVRDVREQMDELQIRIYLEAATISLCGLFVVVCSYQLIEKAGLAGPLNGTIVILLMVGFGLIGYWRAVRRYR